MDLLERELEEILQKALGFDDRRANHESLNSETKIPTRTKVLLGAAAPFLIPIGVAGFLLSAPILGLMRARNIIDGKRKLEDYQKQPHSYLAKRSKTFLQSLTNEVLFEFAQKVMEKTTKVMSIYTSSIPRLIESDRKLVLALINEKRTENEVLNLYGPILNKSNDLRRKLKPLEVELRPATVDSLDLEWKEDQSLCVGEGELAIVYRGKMKKCESHSQSVVVKVFKQPFDEPNSELFLDEEEKIRYVFWTPRARK